MYTQPTISVIICTYGKERFNDVLDATKSVLNQTYSNYEIIIVIDKNRQLYEKYKMALPLDIKLLESERPGLSHARNLGVQNANGHIIAFLDDDAIADKDWLKNMLANYEDTRVVGVGGYVEPKWNGIKPLWFPEELYWTIGCTHKGAPKKKGVVRNVFGCNMSFRRRAFEKVGLFREEIGRVGKKLLAGEETEISIRILSNIPNSKIIYDPAIKVYHKVPKERQTITYILKRSYYEGLSKALIKKKLKGNRLTTESGYIRYILYNSIPNRIKNIFKFNKPITNIKQICIIVFSVCIVGIGYIYGRSRGGVHK